MKAILVDDEPANLENLSALLNKYCPQVEVVGRAEDIIPAIGLIKAHEPDLVFLDIHLGKKSGFDLLNALSEKFFEVIFVTAYDQYGIQAVKFAALDYLLKPLDIDELMLAVDKAAEKIKSKRKTGQLDLLLQYLKNPAPAAVKIALPQQQEIRYVLVNDIVRCEAESSYTFFMLANGDKILISRPLKEYAELLEAHRFIRTHQSHLVNPVFVKSWLKEDGGILLLNNGDRVPVSKQNRENVKESLKHN
jgi:two-component system, LytTR family, response regulator